MGVIFVLAIIVIVYLGIGVLISRGCIFDNEQPTDRLYAALFWPLMVLHIIVQVASGNMKFTSTNKGDRDGSSPRT